jgi:hypothetical protein
MTTTFVHARGDTFGAVFSLAYDTTGWTPTWTLKRRQGWEAAPDTDAVITATVGSGLTHTPGALPGGSTVTLALTAAVMAALDLGVYVWDLQFVSGGNVRTGLFDDAYVGTLTVVGDVRKAVV